MRLTQSFAFQGHAGESLCVCVGAGGLYAASCGTDRALRLYAKTDEPLVLNDTDEQEEGLATGEQHVCTVHSTGATIAQCVTALAPTGRGWHSV